MLDGKAFTECDLNNNMLYIFNSALPRGHPDHLSSVSARPVSWFKRHELLVLDYIFLSI